LIGSEGFRSSRLCLPRDGGACAPAWLRRARAHRALGRDRGGSGHFLGQILLKLRNHGLIRSRRGSRGGYTLARPPEEISVLDVLIAVDGHCLQLSGNHSGRSGRRMRQVWMEIAADIEAKARAVTFDQIASREPDTMYYI